MSTESNVKVNTTDIMAVISIVISVGLKYGLPFVMSVLEDLNNGKITQADIDDLKITKKPEDYLENHNRD